MVAVGGFLPMFFFLTLYMQTVLDYSPIQTGVAYLPLTGGFIVVRGRSPRSSSTRIGTKPVIVVGAVVGAAGLYWLSRIPVDGSYVSDILPGLLVGRGRASAASSSARRPPANAGVGEDKAGLAAGLFNTGQQLGAALGLAILSAVATAHTHALLRGGSGLADAATGGYQWGLLVGAGFVLAAGFVAMLAPNTREAATRRCPMLLSLTTGEWIVAAGSAVVLLLSIVPLVWLGWRFVQMSDDAVARTVADVQRFVELRDRARRAMR